MMHRLLTGLLATEPLLHRARRRSSPGVTVLMYHEVLGDDDAEAWTAVRVSELRRQIEYLKSAVDMGEGKRGAKACFSLSAQSAIASN